VDEASLDLVFALSTTEFRQEKQHELIWAGATKAVTEVSRKYSMGEGEEAAFELAGCPCPHPSFSGQQDRAAMPVESDRWRARAGRRPYRGLA